MLSFVKYGEYIDSISIKWYVFYENTKRRLHKWHYKCILINSDLFFYSDNSSILFCLRKIPYINTLIFISFDNITLSSLSYIYIYIYVAIYFPFISIKTIPPQLLYIRFLASSFRSKRSAKELPPSRRRPIWRHRTKCVKDWPIHAPTILWTSSSLPTIRWVAAWRNAAVPFFNVFHRVSPSINLGSPEICRFPTRPTGDSFYPRPHVFSRKAPLYFGFWKSYVIDARTFRRWRERSWDLVLGRRWIFLTLLYIITNCYVIRVILNKF